MVKSNQPQGLWPYLVILSLLFALCMSMPRSWRKTAEHSARTIAAQRPDPLARSLMSPLDKPQAQSGAVGSNTNPPVLGKLLSSEEYLSQTSSSPDTVTSPLLAAELSPSKKSATLQPVELPLAKKITEQYQPVIQSAKPSQNRHIPQIPTDSVWLAQVDRLVDRVRINLRPVDFRNVLHWSRKLPQTSNRDGNKIVPLENNPLHPSLSRTDNNAPLTPRPLAIPEQPEILAANSPQNLAPRHQPSTTPLTPDQPGPLADAPLPLSAIPQPNTHWPKAWALVQRCEVLRGEETSRLWANRVLACLENLETLSLVDHRSREILAELRYLSQEVGRLPNLKDAPALAKLLHQTQYDLVRRLELWDEMSASATQRGMQAGALGTDISPDTEILQLLQEVQALLATAPQGETWRVYLRIPELAELAQGNHSRQNSAIAGLQPASHGFGGIGPDQATMAIDLTARRRQLARQIVNRLQSAQLDQAQRTFIQTTVVGKLADTLDRWLVEPLSLADIAAQIEQYEATHFPAEGRRLGYITRQLSYSTDPRDQSLARLLDLHYRNANFRVSLSEQILNRLIPAQPAETEQVRERVAGVAANGQSTMFSDVRVRLLPHNSAWNFSFDITGQVDSQTTSRSGPVTFLNRGYSNYYAQKNVLISPAGIHTQPATVSADNRTRLARLRTDYDNVPIMSSIVRNYALRAHEESRPLAQREVSQKVAVKASRKVDSEVDSRMAALEKRLTEQFLPRLERWSLTPQVVDLHTTPTRAVARLRLAGDLQLAAHTARPLLMSDSLASAQLHETLLNNILDQMEVAGRSFTVAELLTHLREKTGAMRATLPADLPDDVRVTFIDEDPLSIRCQEGRIELTLAIAELKQAQRVWRDFEVTVAYRLVPRGLQLQLVRDGTIDLGGEAHTGKLDVVLRGIFAKIFARERQWDLFPLALVDDPRWQGLAWQETISDNGWLGLSLVTGASLSTATQADRATHPQR
ncbi:MAG: hypothetical protein SFX18_14070 [Pirellulales bacterium]|nr:hypothetical protein [Pirellulales bacterium]